MEERQEVHISFEDDCVESLSITRLANHLYRLESTPLLALVCIDDLEVSFGDVIEVEAQDIGFLRFLHIVQRSAWRHWNWLLGKDAIESFHFQAFQQAIEAHGGAWERMFGGVFLIHLPPDCDFDPEAVFEQVVVQRGREGNVVD